MPTGMLTESVTHIQTGINRYSCLNRLTHYAIVRSLHYGARFVSPSDYCKNQ